MAFLKPSDLVWSTSPPSVRGIWASTCSGGDGRRERMSARDRGRGARVGVARGSAGKEAHVQEVDDGSHGIGWGAAMSPERCQRVKRRRRWVRSFFLRASGLGFLRREPRAGACASLLARLARISKELTSEVSPTPPAGQSEKTHLRTKVPQKNPDCGSPGSSAESDGSRSHRLGYDAIGRSFPTARLESTRIATHESIVMPRNVNPDACMDPVLGQGIAGRAPETIMEVRP